MLFFFKKQVDFYHLENRRDIVFLWYLALIWLCDRLSLVKCQHPLLQSCLALLNLCSEFVLHWRLLERKLLASWDNYPQHWFFCFPSSSLTNEFFFSTCFSLRLVLCQDLVYSNVRNRTEDNQDEEFGLE